MYVRDILNTGMRGCISRYLRVLYIQVFMGYFKSRHEGVRIQVCTGIVYPGMYGGCIFRYLRGILNPPKRGCISMHGRGLYIQISMVAIKVKYKNVCIDMICTYGI